ncbi:F-box and WD domain protein [Talaromyces proteolyticus]|uniref:Probable E3 ubiquitin ligase complex SCF subunit sconB n=1 Tax=Talaromyces proteolyticus TaxID=1131652 RepID=A0AAD4KRH8_9EURO|nr:F-box and WD domain protein [Talaromyces proteolyticus]KAH8697616.1 F-box and WD domain protein [Talaromyces proteolyticus]
MDREHSPGAFSRMPVAKSGLAAASLAAAFKLDEGYSDDTRSQPENEANAPQSEAMLLPPYIFSHSEAERAELAFTILRSLRTSTIASVVERLTPRLHMDPVLKLPPEITAEIFAYLDPSTLLTASLASRAWRDRIFDSRLWREIYTREGWRLDIDAIRQYEQLHSEPLTSQSRKSRARHDDSDVPQPQLKRRVTEAGIGPRGLMSQESQPNPPWNEQHQSVEADVPGSPQDAEGDREMRDIYSDSLSSPSAERRPGLDGLLSSMPSPPSAKPSSLLIRSPNGSARINWPHLYKQRRHLEDNWLKGRFVNFQLPHPAHIEEAHTECVYAIQFSGRWLVSGSRDRTVRVWNLDTRRLWYAPLQGHNTSVLCLQFDPSPEEDLIISGGSDRNVIIWKFSTGQKIRELINAHQDSVLNLKFDKRYLVTCSKDKLIKIWNRRELSPMDKDYPTIFRGPAVKYPSYIIDTASIPPSLLEAELANRHIKSLEPFSLLMTLDGHGAAVNAIQINDDEIVSASGDRLIKVWNIHNGACLKTLMGHTKGIACVQFDSQRIVSGSNDDSVRIFDHISGAEVACLEGHNNLVRTVQAGFGDPPGAEEALRLEALAVDNDYWDAQRSGRVPDMQRRISRRAIGGRNAGSRNPRDVMALGARIPPGGGGSRWARIVSGSYDETVIIWRKDRDGKWLAGHRLRQADAVINATATALGRSGRDAPNRVLMRAVHNQQAINPPMAPQQPHPNNQPINVTNNHQGNGNANPASPVTAPQPPTQPQANQPAPPNNNHVPNPLAVLQQAHVLNALVAQQPGAHAHPHQGHRHLGNPPASRVYKLQFDARKIICASQDPRIVGWDFAAGDEDIMEASQFFIGL